MGNCFGTPSHGDKPSHTNFELSNLNSINYIPESSQGEIRSKSVFYVHLVAHTVLENGGNHWDIFLQTGVSESIRLDMTPGAFPGRYGFLGRLDITKHNYPVTTRQQKLVTIAAARRCSVGFVLDAIIQADNHRYEFTKEGRGCTSWVRDQFYLFVQIGLLPPGYEAQFEQAITTAWIGGVAHGTSKVTRGTYLRDRGGNQRQGQKKKGRMDNRNSNQARRRRAR
ncbi:hypothetical protein S40285_10272 [Stachybotrys chlorohalonatus IBT 40285]|uniref:DUF7770 domain-containing protein n=1 Tax=Stachybotrys chlorohalonatus (strain IBT 40285) TaxID=1283841 RepID=A0A084Q9R3_STAC4|nr:hypothetical protein S40285_10272 [Stachybotrys chlorohalonata IBT 40285]